MNLATALPLYPHAGSDENGNSSNQSFPSVFDFGAKGDGETNDTLSMQRAHDLGHPVFYPPGQYVFDSIHLRSGGIIGSGCGQGISAIGATVLLARNEGSDAAISYVGAGGLQNAPFFRNFSFRSKIELKPRAVGIAISPLKSGNILNFSIFDNVDFEYFGTCILIENAASFSILRCNFFFYAEAGVDFSNDVSPDAGDSVIGLSQFFNGNSALQGVIGSAIIQRNSGGLRVVGNKFNGGEYAFHLLLKSTTSDLIISENSFENVVKTAIYLENLSNQRHKPVRFRNILVTSNQFSDNRTDFCAATIPEFNNISYWDDILISSNVSYRRSTFGSCIELFNSRHFLITNNIVHGDSDASTGIIIHDSCYNGRIGGNLYTGYPVPVDVKGGQDVIIY